MKIQPSDILNYTGTTYSPPGGLHAPTKTKPQMNNFTWLNLTPLYWRRTERLMAWSEQDPTASISWDEKCDGVLAYPICGHSVGSNPDTCKAITLPQTSDHNQVLF